MALRLLPDDLITVIRKKLIVGGRLASALEYSIGELQSSEPITDF